MGHESFRQNMGHNHQHENDGMVEKDVICGMKVREDTEFVSEFQGREFYFCSSKCKVEFDKNPLKHSR